MKNSNVPKPGIGIPRHALFLACYLLLSLLMFDPKLFTGGDNATYVILAESLAGGSGYRNIHLPDRPPHTQYPFGFPLMLAPLVKIFGRGNFLIMKIMVILTGLGALYFFGAIARVILKDHDRLAMAFAVSVPVFVTYNHWILSEVPFLFFSLGSVYFTIRLGAGRNMFNLALAMVFALYAFFIRTAGISLVAGLMLFFLLRRRYLPLAVLAILFLAAFIPWQIRAVSAHSEGTYLDQLLAKNPYQMELGRAGATDLLRRIIDNSALYAFNILPVALFPVLPAPHILTGLAGVLIISFTVFALVKRTKNISVIECYFFFGIGVLLLWPKVWSSDRFLLPILPLFVLYFFQTVVVIGRRINRRFFMPALTGTLVLINCFALVPGIVNASADNLAYLKGDKYAGYDTAWRRFFETLDWLRRDVAADKAVLGRKPEFVYLIGRHRSFIFPFSRNPGEIQSAIERADYVLIDPLFGQTRYYLLPVIARNPERYEVVYRSGKPECYLLKVLKKPRGSADLDN